MAYERRGRLPHIDLGLPVAYTPQGDAARAGLPSKSQYAGGYSESGADSVVGRPVITHDVLPAGARPFRLTGYGLYQGGVTSIAFLVPAGYVMAVKSVQVQMTSIFFSHSIPPAEAVVSVLKNNQVELGAGELLFDQFDDAAELNMHLFGADELVVNTVVRSLTPDYIPEADTFSIKCVITGLYLLPNRQSTENNELVVGEVRNV